MGRPPVRVRPPAAGIEPWKYDDPVTAPGRDLYQTSASSPQVRAEEIHAALPGVLRCGGIVGTSPVAVEAVVSRVGVHRGVRLVGPPSERVRACFQATADDNRTGGAMRFC